MKPYTPKQVCEILGISPSTLRRMVKSGKIHCTKTQGGHSRFFKEDVEALLKRPIDNLKEREEIVAKVIGDLSFPSWISIEIAEIIISELKKALVPKLTGKESLKKVSDIAERVKNNMVKALERSKHDE